MEKIEPRIRMTSSIFLRCYLKQQKLLFGKELYLSKEHSIKNDAQFSQNSSESKNTLEEYRISICLCKECNLGETRKNFVYGTGDPNADLMLIGEAPGKDEDLKGEPFVGRAGELLDKILLAIDKKRGRGVYIANVLKCRPPDNRDPLPSEVNKCEPYLIKQIKIVKPKLIVALGRIAGKTLLKIDKPLKEMRGKIHSYNGTPLIVTYHPAALLRNSNFKKPAWDDFQWIRDQLIKYQ